jgi:hypothetical protein
MKLGIPLLIIGVLLLVLSIPLSVVILIGGYNQLTLGNISGGFLAYLPIGTVIIGLILTTIGASRTFKN